MEKKKVIYNELIGGSPVEKEGDALNDSVMCDIIPLESYNPESEPLLEAPKDHPNNKSGKMKIILE